MPLREYRCEDDHVTDELIRSADPIPETTVCAFCGKEARHCLAAFARTPTRFGDSAGYFDRGLGIYVKNTMHRNQVMKKRGLMCLSDLPADAMEKSIAERSASPKKLPTMMIATDSQRAHGAEQINRARAHRSQS